MHTLYLGSSWAVQSFETSTGRDDPVKTNLAQELGLHNYTMLAGYSESNGTQLQKAQEFMKKHANLAPFRIVFVTANSLDDAHKISNTSQVEFAREFLTSKDPIDLVKNLEQQFYHKLNSLSVPVALIGAHTDVECDSYDNITVIHPSWQNFLAKQINLNSFYGWPADLGHRWLQGIVIPEYGSLEHFELVSRPSGAVVSEIYNLFTIIWNKLQKNKLFLGVHPTILGNQLFAQEIQTSINRWIEQF